MRRKRTCSKRVLSTKGMARLSARSSCYPLIWLRLYSFRCGSTDHLAPQCSMPTDRVWCVSYLVHAISFPTLTLGCCSHRCGKKGHISSECPQQRAWCVSLLGHPVLHSRGCACTALDVAQQTTSRRNVACPPTAYGASLILFMQ
jgi:hypothetical protein